MKQKKLTIGNVWIYLQYILLFVVIMTPIAWMLLSSFKSSNAVVAYPPVLKFTPTLQNYIDLFKTLPYFRYTINSIIIAGGSTLFGLLLAIPAAFAISWYKQFWPTSVALLARMAPGGLFLLPWYMMFNKLGMNGTYLVLVLTHTVITFPLSLLIMSSFFDELPKSIMESALVDGCNIKDIILKIAVPLSAPGIMVSMVLTFILSWNYFLFSLVLSRIHTTPLTVAAFRFVGEGVTDWGMLMAAATVLSLPPLIISIFAQRWLVQGLTYGAVKG